MHSFQVVLHRNIRKIREIRGRYIHAKVESTYIWVLLSVEKKNIKNIKNPISRYRNVIEKCYLCIHENNTDCG